jgi:hypothetical protein
MLLDPLVAYMAAVAAHVMMIPTAPVVQVATVPSV